MPLLNFKEIPSKNEEGGVVETFEQFTRDFLEDYGFEILEGPDRGPDGGRDLIVKEVREGVLRSEEFKWLVSCKHYAHSNKSVSLTDEQDIHDRVITNSCDGFIGFYSTTPSSSLTKKLKGIDIDHYIYDNEKIEKDLRRSENGLELIERYFPKSHQNIIIENPTPSNIFDKELELNCEVCDTNILTNDSGGVLALGEKNDIIEDIYVACKGKCDHQMEHQFMQRGLVDMWFEVTDFQIPLTFFDHLMLLKRDFLFDLKFTSTADYKLSRFLLISFQHVARDQTKNERERVERVVNTEDMLQYFKL